MKNANNEKRRRFQIAFIGTLMLLMFPAHPAKSSPPLQRGKRIAFERAKKLDNGISISWLEQTWGDSLLKREGVGRADMALLKKLGFKTIRLPVAFRYFEEKKIPLSEVLARTDKVWKMCRKYGFRLIIDYHYGNLNNENHVQATHNIINTWLAVATHYLKADADALFFEIYNEPPPIDPQVWKDAACNIVAAIRKLDSRRTLLVGASNYNSIYELSRFVPLKDNNIIYAFHFYEPFLFTHQGAGWVGDQVATTGVPFPYNEENFPPINPKAIGTAGEQNYNKYHLDGNEQSVKDKLQIVKNWGQDNAVPLICSEYGSYNKYADLTSRCQYTRAVRQALKSLGIPGILWDYNTNFSIFNGSPSVEDLPDCMKDAIGYTGK